MCLYSAASMLARSLSAVAHRVFSRSCSVLLVALTAALRPGFFFTGADSSSTPASFGAKRARAWLSACSARLLATCSAPFCSVMDDSLPSTQMSCAVNNENPSTEGPGKDGQHDNGSRGGRLTSSAQGGCWPPLVYICDNVLYHT
ncbi:hypothetical protein D3C85_742580 [compost metagenome]